MKLSKLKYFDILFKASKEDLEKIVFEGDYPDIKVAQYGIVFGGIGMIPYRVDAALKLYREGLIKKIFLSGGVGYLNLNRLTPESYKMYDYLKQKGIKDEDIIIENKSRNTIENIEQFLKTLKKDNIKVKSLTLITSDFHLKRCIETLRKYLGDDTNIYGKRCYDSLTDKDVWKNTFKGRRIILREALLLCYYAKHSYLKDLDISSLSYLEKEKGLKK